MAACKAVEVIDVSEHKPRRIPSAKWRELINPPSPKLRWTVGRFRVWVRCSVRKCSREMRIIALIDDREVIERILRHLGLWNRGYRVHSGTDPPNETILDPWLDDPFPDFYTEPVMAFAKN